jgi:hypothetical protein
MKKKIMEDFNGEDPDVAQPLKERRLDRRFPKGSYYRTKIEMKVLFSNPEQKEDAKEPAVNSMNTRSFKKVSGR